MQPPPSTTSSRLPTRSRTSPSQPGFPGTWGLLMAHRNPRGGRTSSLLTRGRTRRRRLNQLSTAATPATSVGPHAARPATTTPPLPGGVKTTTTATVAMAATPASVASGHRVTLPTAASIPAGTATDLPEAVTMAATRRDVAGMGRLGLRPSLRSEPTLQWTSNCRTSSRPMPSPFAKHSRISKTTISFFLPPRWSCEETGFVKQKPTSRRRRRPLHTLALPRAARRSPRQAGHPSSRRRVT